MSITPCYGFDENVTWIKNNHSFKFGYSYQKMMLNTNNRNTGGGQLHTSTAAAPRSGRQQRRIGKPVRQLHAGRSLSAADFTIPITEMLRFPYHAFFAQDDWKITPRLTMNIGLRYEIDMGVYEKHDRLSYFDPTLPNPAANGHPGALRFLGDGAGPRRTPQSLRQRFAVGGPVSVLPTR